MISYLLFTGSLCEPLSTSPLGKILEPKLTTIHFYYKTSGMEAAEMLTSLMESGNGGV